MTPEAFLDRAANFSLAVDGGAYKGSWTLPMAARFKRVLAFELCPEWYHELVWNTAELMGHVVPLNIALGNAELDIYYVGDKNEASPIKRVYPGGNLETGKPSTPVRMMRLDKFNLRALDFLKLDLQGYEVFALKGAEQTIKKFRPLIHLEMDEGSQQTFDVVGKAEELLVSWGYDKLIRAGDEELWGHHGPAR